MSKRYNSVVFLFFFYSFGTQCCSFFSETITVYFFKVSKLFILLSTYPVQE